jgi:hypothetical protein
MRRGAVCACICLLGLVQEGCTSGTAAGLTETQMAHDVLATFDAVTADNHCSGTSLDVGGPLTLMPLTPEICLGCANVGWMMREWNRTDLGPPMVVVASTTFADEMCSFLRRERVSLPVVAFDTDSLPAWWNDAILVLIAERLEGGTVGRLASGLRGDLIINQWKGLTNEALALP